MKRTWDRIHVWLAAHAPDALGDLRPGASDDQFRAAEDEMGVRLPDAVKACYRIHNGAKGRVFFLFDWYWNSLETMRSDWRRNCQLCRDGALGDWRNVSPSGVRAEWYHHSWIPLTDSGAGDGHCLDLDPAPGGRSGQILCWLREDGSRHVQAGSIREWLNRFADEVEAGARIFWPLRLSGGCTYE